jgi:hypothetical protein
MLLCVSNRKPLRLREAAQPSNGKEKGMKKLWLVTLFKVAVQEGEQARITDNDLKLDMAFIPVRQEDGIRVRMFRIEKHPTGDESMHFIEEIETKIGEIGYARKAPSTFSVRVLQVGDPLTAGQEGILAKGCNSRGVSGNLTLKFGGGGRCCVTCGGTHSCGCAVDDYCGSCCSGGCCAF